MTDFTDAEAYSLGAKYDDVARRFLYALPFVPLGLSLAKLPVSLAVLGVSCAAVLITLYVWSFYQFAKAQKLRRFPVLVLMQAVVPAVYVGRGFLPPDSGRWLFLQGLAIAVFLVNQLYALSMGARVLRSKGVRVGIRGPRTSDLERLNPQPADSPQVPQVMG